MTWKIVTGGVSDNPYDIVLADLLLSEEISQAQLEAKDIGVRRQCGQLKPRMLKIQRFWAYILDFFI